MTNSTSPKIYLVLTTLAVSALALFAGYEMVNADTTPPSQLEYLAGLQGDVWTTLVNSAILEGDPDLHDFAHGWGRDSENWFSSTGQTSTGDYGGFSFRLAPGSTLTALCWDNMEFSGDHMQSGYLYGSADNVTYTLADSGSFGVANYCLNANAVIGRYWKLLGGDPPKWRKFGNVDIQVTGGTPPTATPGPQATDFPQMALPCITGTTNISPTVRATMTPYGRTTTPVPTRTPGGPTPTPTTMVTVTVQPPSGTVGYDSGVIKFDTDVSLSQLSAVGMVNDPSWSQSFLRWSSELGNDGKPGVAMMHAGIGNVLTDTAADMSTNTIVAMFKTGGYVSPVAVSFYARTAYTQTVGSSHWMRVWYLDPDYNGPGQGVWVTTWDLDTPPTPPMPLSNSWRKFGAVVTAVGGSGKISAIAFTDEGNTPGGASTPPCPVSSGGVSYGCVYIDDLRIAYGSAAGLVLPYCDGTDPNGGVNTRSTKTCVINITTIDLQAMCVAPTTVDFGAWLSYFWCRLWRFLGFFEENRAQVDAIITRQSVNEPFGSVFETSAIYDDLNTSIDSLRQSNKAQPQNPIDWVATFMDGSALDHLPQFTVPDIASAQVYMSNCPSEAMFSSSTASGACMALYMMRQTIIITLFQWGLNALFVVGVLMMVRSDLEKLAS